MTAPFKSLFFCLLLSGTTLTCWGYPYVIKPHISSNISGMTLRPLEATSTEQKELEFLPNVIFNPGISLKLRWFSFSYSFSQSSISEDILERKGKTSGDNYAFSSFWGQQGLTAFYQRLKGYHLNNPSALDPTWQEGDIHPQYPTMIQGTQSLTYYYNFGPQHFSLPAIFDQSEQVPPSGWTWISTASVGQVNVKNQGGAFLPAGQRAFYPEDGTIEDIRLLDLNATIGPAAVFNLHQYYVAGFFSLGPSFQYQSQKSEDRTEEFDTNLHYATNAIITLGYSGENFVAGFFIHSELVKTFSKELEFDFSRGMRQSFIGYRF